MENDLAKAIARIRGMEQLFDTLSAAVEEGHPLADWQDTIDQLSDYYQNGDWLHDYELDEQHLLLPTLKRGVLSQDGLYNLLNDIDQIYNKT